MKILLTGNCGFISQNLVRLYRNEHQFVGVDKMGYAADPKAAKLCPTWQIDTAHDDLEPIFKHERFDAIINAAAESHVDNSILSPELFMHSNFLGTFRMLEMARKYKVPKFLQVSTDEVYGDLQLDDPPFSNDFLIRPSSPYSASKASADLLVLSYSRTYGINTVITRSCNNYGPFQYKEKFIPVVITRALNNQDIPVYGNGSNCREWIFVDDNCCGLMAALEKGSGIFNIGSGIEKSNINLVKQILSIMGKPESLIKFVEDRKGHDLRYAMDSTKSLRYLDWQANVHLDNGLKKTVNWYINNPNYWEEKWK